MLSSCCKRTLTAEDKRQQKRDDFENEIIEYTQEQRLKQRQQILEAQEKAVLEMRLTLDLPKKHRMEFLESELNSSLFVAWNKKYVGYVFWNNMGTPINFTITLLTAMTAAKSTSTSSTFLSDSQNTIISITVLLISAVNTFFRPYNKATEHMKFITEVQKYGAQFDEVFYKAKLTNEEYEVAYNKYFEIQQNFNKYKSENSIESKNLIVDIIYFFVINITLFQQRKDRIWTKVQYV
jgi:hypothetical protein